MSTRERVEAEVLRDPCRMKGVPSCVLADPIAQGQLLQYFPGERKVCEFNRINRRQSSPQADRQTLDAADEVGLKPFRRTR